MQNNLKTLKTGDLFAKNNNLANCTLRKPIAIVIKEIRGPYTELDRKLWNVLMYLGCEELTEFSLQAKYHSVDEHKLISLFSEYSGLKDIELIWNSLKRLTATAIDIEIEDDLCKIYEATNLINARIIENKKDRTGRIEYMFPPAIAKLAQDPERFSRIRMHFMLGLRGKYSVSMYEILESRVNMSKEFHEWSLKDFRKMIGVPENKLSRWVDLKRFAIDPFIKEINGKPDQSGFKVDCKPITGQRRKVVALRFYLEKDAARKKLERNITKIKNNFNQNSLSRSFSTVFYEDIKKEMPDIDVYSLKEDWENSIKSLGETVKNREGHFRNFCRKQYRKQRHM